MKKESNLIDTKENLKENYLIEKEEKELIFLEKSCNILSVLLKIEAVITVGVITFAFIHSKNINNNIQYQTEYGKVTVSEEID